MALMSPNDRSVGSMWGVMWGAEATGEPLYLKINFSAQTLRRRTRFPYRRHCLRRWADACDRGSQRIMLVDLGVALGAAPPFQLRVSVGAAARIG